MYVSILSPDRHFYLHVAHVLCMLCLIGEELWGCCKRCHTERKRRSESMDQMALCPYLTNIALTHLHISTCVLLSREIWALYCICSFCWLFFFLNANKMLICNNWVSWQKSVMKSQNDLNARLLSWMLSLLSNMSGLAKVFLLFSLHEVLASFRLWINVFVLIFSHYRLPYIIPILSHL